MPFRTLIALSLAIPLLAACSEAPPTAGEPKDFGAVCDEANGGKRVRVDGYLRLPDSFRGPRGAVLNVVLELYPAGDFKGRAIGVLTDFGSQSNQVEKVAKQFSDTDLKVHLRDGQEAPYGTKVRVSGKVSFPNYVGWPPLLLCRLDKPLMEPAS